MDRALISGSLHESIDAIREQAKKLGQEVARLNEVADNLEGRTSPFFWPPIPPTSEVLPTSTTFPSDHELANSARTVSKYRLSRDNYFPKGLFGEPAWNMLVDLFITHTEGTPVSVSSLGIASGSAPTTALRHMEVLENHGLIERYPSVTDRRVILVQLTAEGVHSMREFLTQGKPSVDSFPVKMSIASN